MRGPYTPPIQRSEERKSGRENVLENVYLTCSKSQAQREKGPARAEEKGPSWLLGDGDKRPLSKHKQNVELCDVLVCSPQGITRRSISNAGELRMAERGRGTESLLRCALIPLGTD